MSAAHFCSNYPFYFLLAWLPLYLVKSRGLSIGTMTSIATAAFIAQGLAALLLGWLSDRWVANGADEDRVRRRLMAVSQLIVAGAVMGAAVAPGVPSMTMWLIVAAAGTFAAFPGWYATMFSGFYLAFLLLLVALIARGVSFEFYGKRDSARWRRAWDAATTGGSLLAPLLIGVALGNLLHGVPIGTDQEYAGTFTDLLNPYSLFTGVTVVLLCLLHGASFLVLKTVGEVRERPLQHHQLTRAGDAEPVAFAHHHAEGQRHLGLNGADEIERRGQPVALDLADDFEAIGAAGVCRTRVGDRLYDDFE